VFVAQLLGELIIFLNIQFIGLPESVLPQPVPNRTYYSLANTLSLYSEFVGSDGFDCKWNTVPKENTTKFYCIIFIFYSLYFPVFEL
jgi:hypothetical protein